MIIKSFKRNFKEKIKKLLKCCVVYAIIIERGHTETRDVAQLGSAPGLGPGCRRFKSCHPDHLAG